MNRFFIAGWHRDGQELRKEIKNLKLLPRAVSTHFLEKDSCTVIEELIRKVSL